MTFVMDDSSLAMIIISNITILRRSFSEFFNWFTNTPFLKSWRHYHWKIQNMLYDDSNRIQTHNHLVCKRTLNHLTKLTSLAKWLSVCLQIKVVMGSNSIAVTKTSNIAPVLSKEFVYIQETKECRFTLKRVNDILNLPVPIPNKDKKLS